MVDVYISPLKEKYDFYMDENRRVQEILEGIIKILCEIRNEDISSGFFLFSCELETVLPEEKSLKELGIKNGDRLLLI